MFDTILSKASQATENHSLKYSSSEGHLRHPHSLRTPANLFQLRFFHTIEACRLIYHRSCILQVLDSDKCELAVLVDNDGKIAEIGHNSEVIH